MRLITAAATPSLDGRPSAAKIAKSPPSFDPTLKGMKKKRLTTREENPPIRNAVAKLTGCAMPLAMMKNSNIEKTRAAYSVVSAP